MAKYIRMEVDGQKFDRCISGTLVNPNHVIEVTFNIEPLPNSDVLVVVYPKKDENIGWIDDNGNKHMARLMKGKGIAVDKKFIFESSEVF